MANTSVTTVPHASIQPGSPEGHILAGPPGKSMIHKVGSAKQYATKSTGRVCNQAKFPMRKKG